MLSVQISSLSGDGGHVEILIDARPHAPAQFPGYQSNGTTRPGLAAWIGRVLPLAH